MEKNYREFWQFIDAMEGNRRHEVPSKRFFSHDDAVDDKSRWASAVLRHLRSDDDKDIHYVMGKPHPEVEVVLGGPNYMAQHWYDVYSCQAREGASIISDMQKRMVDKFNGENFRKLFSRGIHLNKATKIPMDKRVYPLEIFYFPTQTSTKKFHPLTAEGLNEALAGVFQIDVDDVYGMTNELSSRVNRKVVEQAYVVLDVTDDRVLLFPWLFQQPMHLPNNLMLHVYETFLLSVSKSIITNHEQLLAGSIVCHLNDPDADPTILEFPTWKGILAENGVYDLCMLGNQTKHQKAELFCLPAWECPEKGIVKPNLLSEHGVRLLQTEPLALMNIVDGVEMMHNNFTISTSRHESSTPERPKWVDTWQDKRKTLQLDLRTSRETGGRSIITRCVECNQKAYVITPSPNPDIGAADCPTCRGKGTINFQNLLDGAELQSEFPMAGRR